MPVSSLSLTSERWDLYSYDDKLFWLSLTLKFNET